MPVSSPTILFFGTEDFSLTALQALVEANFSIGAVVTKPDTKRGRHQRLTAPAVKTYALAHAIPVWQPTSLRDIATEIQRFDRPLGVLVSYGKIIPQSIIDLFRPGIINLHPSLLPLYRGPSPIEAAIRNRDQQTGISLMLLSAAMDAGPVYTQVPYRLSGHETQSELYHILGCIGAKVLVEQLPNILNGTLQPRAQDDNHATYTHLLGKADGIIDPQHHSATEAEAMVRAYMIHPRARVVLGSHQCIVTAAHVTHTKDTPLSQLCADGLYLAIDELIAPSGKHLTASEFIRGYNT